MSTNTETGTDIGMRGQRTKVFSISEEYSI